MKRLRGTLTLDSCADAQLEGSTVLAIVMDHAVNSASVNAEFWKMAGELKMLRPFAC